VKPANLDIDFLRSFAAVADSGSFTGGADLVARTQSAVSVQIRKLEHTLGARVFERTSRSVALTPAGRTLLDYARRILALNDESVRRIAEPLVAGVMRIGITEYFVPHALPRLLARFASSHPDVELQVRMGLSRDLRAALAAGALDVAIVRRAARERLRAAWIEPQVWVTGHAFAQQEDGVLPLVLLPSPCILRAFALDVMKRSRRPYKIAFTGSSMTSVVAAVRAGLGVSIVPRSALVPGLEVLRGRRFPNPGRLEVAVLRQKGAPEAIVSALERVIGETLGGSAPELR
jgi:DNA-binding transcriptional LysR family regulator